MSVLICGSLAFDTITNFPGRFAQQILPEQVHILNVSFLVPTLRREFGGCAGNIAYTLQLLGGAPLVMAALGSDGGEYLQRLKSWGLDTSLVRQEAEAYTAQAIIITDQDNNQITAFHPGAMQQAHATAVPTERGDIALAIIAPDGRDAMIEHAAQLAAAKIPFVFDPGQGLPMFNGAELSHFIELATYVAVNDYEAELLTERTGLSLQQIADHVSALVVTRGEQGAEIYTSEGRIDIPVVAADVVDPTGCGDAFRAGMLFGLTRDMDWTTIGRLSSLMGAIKIASQGGQNHAPTLDEIEDRFFKAYGYRF